MVSQIITELRDDMGRSVSYTYAKNGSVQQTVSTGYGVDGRIASAGFVHGGAVKQFGYAYLNGTNLLQTLTMPNNMSLTQSFEEKRDLLTQMDYKRGNTLVSRRVYTYDTLARPLTRTTSRQGQTINDSFVHTYRSELASAQLNGEIYGYDYDNIGNRRMAMEASDYAFYEANNLNQYRSIQRNEEEAFVPSFDADGNQTLVRTATGIWSVSYNAENRPVIFQKTTDSVTTRITCSYDSMGRRATKKVEEITTDAEGNESADVISHHRFIYRGYLQIACCDLTRTAHPCLWLITWDPTQPVATRPLAIQKDGTWFCYGWDLTKNICEVFGQNGYIRTAYSYTPYGSVIANGDITQPIQWSSEYDDTELALVYYNYRHYNPMDGRWLSLDPLAELLNLYVYGKNNFYHFDILGLFTNYKNNLDRVRNTIEVGVYLEWWDDDGGPGGNKGTLRIGQQDELITKTRISAKGTCRCGEYEFIDASVKADSRSVDFWWGTMHYSTDVSISKPFENMGLFVFSSEITSEGTGGVLTNIIAASIGFSITSIASTFTAGLAVAAATALATEIMERIGNAIVADDKNKWSTSAVLLCKEYKKGDPSYSKPTVIWGPIKPDNIGTRESSGTNRGYEHYVPIFKRIIK